MRHVVIMHSPSDHATLGRPCNRAHMPRGGPRKCPRTSLKARTQAWRPTGAHHEATRSTPRSRHGPWHRLCASQRLRGSHARLAHAPRAAC